MTACWLTCSSVLAYNGLSLPCSRARPPPACGDGDSDARLNGAAAANQPNVTINSRRSAKCTDASSFCYLRVIDCDQPVEGESSGEANGSLRSSS